MNPMEFNIPEEDRLPFSQYYKQHIEPKCQQYEQQRLPIVAKQTERQKISKPVSFIATVIGLMGFAYVFYGMATSQGNFTQFFIGISLFIISLCITVGVIFWANGESSKFRDQIVKVIHPIVLRYFGDNFLLNPEGLKTLKEYEPYGIFPSYDIGAFEDSVSGEYKGVTFLMRELSLSERETTKDNQAKYKTLFDGIIIEFDSFKSFKGETQVRLDKGTIGNKLAAFQTKLPRVNLEDVEFEQQFEVYSSDQIEARYLLTPTMMTRLLSLSTFYLSQLEASFKDGKLLIKLATTHNYFESRLDIGKPLDVSADIELLFRELNEVFALIDALKLDEQTGL
ncbi:hypothetical protein TUM4438_34140 [Shewanella sairae]|uniref:DUF3137 domain-containing protein n=1 Tax=Shewanella sairae TaxID=190310 RepID=A0ABQ4PNC2_9GAMM|nr:DUF3137 domain-containing protein [Shewanella sairae]MCL1130255.1 DUF3137 domain-containing protein [Shewanella sairae]GIU49776.1 hypothetical protein TUM4438_34140 [Shewanella sairae]